MTNRKDKIDEYANKLKKWDERIIEAEKNLAELADDMKDSAKKEINNLKTQITDEGKA
jgi:vacuolar-type H+-ATPase subunit H